MKRSDVNGTECGESVSYGGMEFCVLGLLMIRDMTIYEIHQAFRKTLSLFYSGSMGSIQFALRKLLARGLVARTEETVGKRTRKVYTVLAPGRAAFAAEMLAEIPPAKLETTALARMSFLGHLESHRQRAAVLQSIVRSITAALASLEALRAEVAQIDPAPETRDVFQYQVHTLDYGIMAHNAGLAWFRDRLREAEQAAEG